MIHPQSLVRCAILCAAVLTASARAEPVFSVNYGSSVIGGLVPIPRSADFSAGVVDAAFWNNHIGGIGNFLGAGQAGPWILSNGVEPEGMRLRVTTETNSPLEASYFSSENVGGVLSNNQRLATDTYVTTTGNDQLGFDLEGLPEPFARGWNLYVHLHFASPFAFGRMKVEVDLNTDGGVDHTLFARHIPDDRWLSFTNASQSETLEGVGEEHSSFVVFRNIGAGVSDFSVTATNVDGRRVGITAFQVEAIPEPTAAAMALIALGGAVMRRSRPIR